MKGERELDRDKIYFRRHAIEFDDGSNVGNKEKEKLHISTESTEYFIAPPLCLQEEKCIVKIVELRVMLYDPLSLPRKICVIMDGFGSNHWSLVDSQVDIYSHFLIIFQ